VIIDAVPDMLGLDERMTPFSAHLLSHLFTNATPIQVSGDVEYLVNRTAKGWIVTLFNNRGVYNPNRDWPRLSVGSGGCVNRAERGGYFHCQGIDRGQSLAV